MKWYIARVLYQWHVDNQRVQDYYDEQFILIRGETAEDAYQKVSEQCRAQERTFQNVNGDWNTEKFLGFIDLDCILSDVVESGTELYSILHRGFNVSDMLTPKERLRAFWAEQNKDKPIGELLDPSDMPFVQR